MPDAERPNILVIWGDDIGITNLSCYGDGVMGYRTPNIDRIADEGMRFTHSKVSRAARRAAPPSSPGRARSGPA
jgi:arylsulfatase A-like enzyme